MSKYRTLTHTFHVMVLLQFPSCSSYVKDACVNVRVSRCHTHHSFICFITSSSPFPCPCSSISSQGRRERNIQFQSILVLMPRFTCSMIVCINSYFIFACSQSRKILCVVQFRVNLIKNVLRKDNFCITHWTISTKLRWIEICFLSLSLSLSFYSKKLFFTR